MKDEELFRAIGRISDDKIAEAEAYEMSSNNKRKQMRSPWLKWAPTAAAACLVIVFSIFAFPVLRASPDGSDVSDGSTEFPPDISEGEIVAPAPDEIMIRGMTFSTDLTELNLRGQGLTDMDVQSLRYMTSLKELNLVGNPLSRAKIEELRLALPGCEIIVDELSYEQLWHAIEKTMDGVLLVISWHDDRTTVFERELGSQVWMMQSRDINAANAHREVYPTFVMEDDIITMGFPTTTRFYYLLEDGTGHFSDPDGTRSEALTWEFTLFQTPQFFSYEQLWHSIDSTMDGVALAVSWYDDQTTVFRRELGNRIWMMQSRDINAANAYREVYPTFAMEDDVITIGFPTTTRLYYLFEDGTGYFRNPDGTRSEGFTWSFAIYDRFNRSGYTEQSSQ